MMKSPVLTFLARSSKRDAKIDESRLSGLAHAFDATIGGLAEERSGLIARVKGLVVSDENASRFSRKPELSLVEFKRVEGRLDLLARQISLCRHLKDLIDSSWPTAD